MSNKALAKLRAMKDEDFAPDNATPLQLNVPADPRVPQGLAAIAEALGQLLEKPEPEEKPAPDYSKVLGIIANALTGMMKTTDEIKGLRGEVAKLSDAMARQKPADMPAIAKALADVAAANSMLAEAMMCEREVITNGAGEITGTRVRMDS